MKIKTLRWWVDSRAGAASRQALAVALLLLVSGCASPWQNELADLEAQDSQLALAIKVALIEAPGLAGSAIDVAVAQGQATLTGFVENRSQREQAVQVAGDHEGVSQVVDQIIVK